ncbi:RHS repeat domain-containing protein [Aureicoccus marinus]|uniref:RHS repeat-associated core domain-containing protein n=1 Tax=Aureicoccus marinus TaxID=754435 RepID=A0A2S7TAT1_9FLAO|nr:hypothetical protein [Aureicoccus marinus]PQJ16576.1 hypothetical protein BST99_13360 [Aureicoccus marinus]
MEETTSTHSKTGQSTITSVDKFTYNQVGALSQATNQINGGATEVIAQNIYNDIGQLIEKSIGGKTNQNRLQDINYIYNVRGWLTDINNPDNKGSDLFAMRLYYDRDTHSTNATPLYNGNISQVMWSTKNTNSSKFYYFYHYDHLNRITKAQFAGGGWWDRYSLKKVEYDKNGNITKLERKGWTNSAATSFGTMDNLVYTYSGSGIGNQLIKVQDNSNINFGFKDVNQTTDYTYDSNGNMTRDYNKAINTNMTYNHLNLPTYIPINGGSISYYYDAAGVKQKKVVSGGATTEYAGSFIYKNGSLEHLNHPEGYLEPDGNSFRYIYQYRDQINNLRLAYSDLDGNSVIDHSSEILIEKNYYPFGLEHMGYNSTINGVVNNYKQYQGQEFIEDLELNIHEWKFRISDPTLGRFWSVDPLAEDYRFQSPYNFSENRVIDGFELEGLEYVTVHHIMNGGTHITTLPATEYYKMTDSEINEKNGTPAGNYNAASYGPEGKGVKHVYHNRDGSYTGPYEDGTVRWDNRRINFQTAAGNHGLYSGAGSITNYRGGQDYNFDFQPIDWSDAIAKRHDEDYETARANADGPGASYIDDVNTYQADLDMIERLNTFTSGGKVEGIETPYRKTSSREMELSLKGQKIVISALAAYKKWKIDNNYGNDTSFETLGQKFYKDDFLNALIISIIYSSNE